jgi:hypothetical protein
MEDESVISGSSESIGPAPGAAVEPSAMSDRPSSWLVLAFIALLSLLAVLGTTGAAAAASTLLGGPPVDCGGP